ncbi:MAG TPA: DUF72 domain-containing protein [Methyloceanibacter sp.]|nr:DUF72 domain-containing protein [Methyloceanibacter sp.]
MNQQPLWIGTAGWNVPARYEVPVGRGQLDRYARALNAVEINSSFYRPHQRKTYERWALATPEAFRFSVKMPRTITHQARLANCDAMLDRFIAEVTGLGYKLGVLLVQLPPKLAFDEHIAGRFFQKLQARIVTPVALEPRNASWFAPDMEAWLAANRVARVAADPARVDGSQAPGGWNGLVYYRWHGAPKIYYSNYDDAALAALRLCLNKGVVRGAQAWCIFDNTASGAAFGNALTLASSEKA